MEQNKIGFFKRIKIAITDFDGYKNFIDEKKSVAIKYLLKIILILALIITIATTIKVITEINKNIQAFNDECPDFKIEHNKLLIEEENKQFIIGDETKLFGLIIDSEKDKLQDIDQANDYIVAVAILKDKIIFKFSQNTESVIKYDQIEDTRNINKQVVLSKLTQTNMIKIYAVFCIITLIYSFIVFFIDIIIDILLLSLIGALLNVVISTNLKYKSVFNMSVYALTLSIILLVIYMIVNLFTGFEIKYFTIAYNSISYVYLITAMMMIRSDLIKAQIEIKKIIEEQKKIREEKNKEEEQKEEKNKEKGKEGNEKKEKKKDKKEDTGTLEGGNA